MDRAERAALLISGVLMLAFLGALGYAATRLNISVPTCVTDVAPFREGKLIDKGNQHYEVHMVAKMWSFDPPEVTLPPGSEVDIYLSSVDVLHGLYIEKTNVNLMAVPGAVNTARVRFDEEGEYPFVCHEYCGAAHHYMAGKIVIAAGTTVPVAPVRAAVAAERGPGQDIFEEQGCAACHTVDGSRGIGPTVKGLFGRQTRFADGSTRTADEAYVEQSLRDPNALIVEGYQPIMPAAPLTDEQVKQLVEYLKSLS